MPLTAANVGNATVCGVAGASVLIDNCSLYWGVIGGTTAVSYVTFSRPKAGSGAYLEPSKISLGGPNANMGIYLRTTQYTAALFRTDNTKLQP